MIYSNLALKTNLRAHLTTSLSEITNLPKLHIIQVGRDFASTKYVGIKQKLGASIGIPIELHQFEENTSVSQLQDFVAELEQTGNGLIFQLPLPDNLYSLLDEIPIFSDVDFLGPNNNFLWLSGLLPPTIQAIDLVLKDILSGRDLTQSEPHIVVRKLLQSKLDLSGKVVAVVGQGKLVGFPLLRYLAERGATILSLNIDTKNPKVLAKQADIVISAAGSPGLINQNWLKENTIIIDAATSEDQGFQVGDVDSNLELPSGCILVPSPGGVGPLTVLCLFENLLRLSSLPKN